MSAGDLTPAQASALFGQGTAALRERRPADARTAFARIAAAGLADATVWIATAHAALMAQDRDAAAQALDQALAIEPENIAALMAKGDLRVLQGDSRGASAFYRAVVRIGAAAPDLPPELRHLVQRAAAACEQQAGQFERALREALGAGSAGPRPPRFDHSIDLLTGRRQRYMQNPLVYCYPELPQIQFYDDRSAFPWMQALEAQTGAIRDELRAVLDEGRDLEPYVRSDPNRPGHSRGEMIDNPAWSAYYLWRDGHPAADHARRCPRTMAALEAVPLARLPGRSPSVLFSVLRPGARIPPHHGLINTRLICHLPLIVPPNCGFRVGNETRQWVEGQTWAFDDTIEHEAWNRSERTRVILLFEIWRPELGADEREWVCRLFEAIDAAGGTGLRWAI